MAGTRLFRDNASAASPRSANPLSRCTPEDPSSFARTMCFPMTYGVINRRVYRHHRGDEIDRFPPCSSGDNTR